jgi:hypothetical protein
MRLKNEANHTVSNHEKPYVVTYDAQLLAFNVNDRDRAVNLWEICMRHMRESKRPLNSHNDGEPRLYTANEFLAITGARSLGDIKFDDPSFVDFVRQART